MMSSTGTGVRGLSPGYRDLTREKRKSEADSSSVLVNMWNHTSFPAYKSRLWNMAGTANEGQEAVEKRRP